MPAFELNIQDWGIWTEGAALPESRIPPLLRRRITPVGRAALELAWSLPNLAKARYVYASRHGEFERTLTLMNAVANGDEPSPADFSLSVHHALIGLLSIAQKNRSGHTAIAAGPDSFCFGLMEAAACLNENPDEPVIFVHADTLLPEPYDAFAPVEERPIVMALALTADTAPLRITQSWTYEPSAHPRNHALNFLNFLNSGTTTCVSQGHEHRWQWQRHALA